MCKMPFTVSNILRHKKVSKQWVDEGQTTTKSFRKQKELVIRSGMTQNIKGRYWVVRTKTVKWTCEGENG